MAEVVDHAQPAGQGQSARPTCRRRPRGLAVGGGLVFSDKRSQFVDLHLGEGQIAYERGADHGTMLSCQCEPVQHAVRRAARKTGHCPETAALAQKRQSFKYRRRGLRRVSKNVCLSALNVCQHVAQ